MGDDDLRRAAHLEGVNGLPHRLLALDIEVRNRRGRPATASE